MSSPTPQASWRPLLDGDDAARAWEAIDAIAEDLRDPERVQAAEAEVGAARNASMAGGDAGHALLFAYLAAARDSNADAELAGLYLDRAIEALAETPMMPGLYSGFSGVAWVAEHIDPLLAPFYEAENENENAEDGEDEDDGEASDIDTALISMLDRSSWHDDYDLISGLAGYGVYALEVLPRPSGRKLLELLVDHFERLAVDSEPGRSWFTAPELLPEHQREVCPKGYFNAGLAHGVPAVIAILALAASQGIETRRALGLVEDAVTWLLGQKIVPPQNGLSFPSWAAESMEAKPARLAWCYGDAGVAASLMLAARAAGREDWENAAVQVARDSATCSFEDSRIIDAGLCHGATSLGHIFNRFYQATGAPEMAEAAQRWYAEALGMREPGRGPGGYLAWSTRNMQDEMAWIEDRAFLTGTNGIALGLLAAVSPLEPLWDRVLLTSIPPTLHNSDAG